MIRLEKNESEIDSILEAEAAEAKAKAESAKSADSAKSAESATSDSTPISAVNPANATPSELSVENFSTEVFKTLLGKKVLPIPQNYQAYFEMLLNTKDLGFQRRVLDLMENDGVDSERHITFEKSIHLAFANTRDILKCTSSIYKNLVMMNDIEREWSVDLQASNAESAPRFVQETRNIQQEIDTQINQLKTLYQKCNKILESINTNTMYDAKFGTYNKRYFIYLVQNEQNLVDKFAHTSTVIMMSLPPSVTRYLQNDQQSALVVMKTVAKLLLKTSRRSDIIGYVGNGIFAMLLKHSDIVATQRASERLIELLKNTNVFLDNKEVNLDLNIGIAKLKSNRNAEDSLNFAISALRGAQKANTAYLVYKDDRE